MPTETGSQWIRRLYRPGVRERGYRILAREMEARAADAELFALIERAKAASALTDKANDAAEEHPDVLQAQALLETRLERSRELALRIATTPAKTKEGLIAKLAMVWPAYADDELDGTYDGVVASAVRDAKLWRTRSRWPGRTRDGQTPAQSAAHARRD
jgi:hypothetical protein